MAAQLKRLYRGDDGIFGAFFWNNKPIAVTLELPWKDNARNISCIPQERYKCVRVNSRKFGETFQLIDVPNREGILIHWGNTIKDTEGCILLGTGIGNTESISITQSRVAFERFLQITADVSSFILEVA